MSYVTTLEVDTTGNLNDGIDVDEDSDDGRPRLVAAAVECASDYFHGEDRDWWIDEVRRIFPDWCTDVVRYCPWQQFGPFLSCFRCSLSPADAGS